MNLSKKYLKKKPLFILTKISSSLDVVVVVVGSAGLVGRHGWLQSRRSSSRRLRWVLCVCVKEDRRRRRRRRKSD
jgi:hypothetical protein